MGQLSLSQTTYKRDFLNICFEPDKFKPSEYTPEMVKIIAKIQDVMMPTKIGNMFRNCTILNCCTLFGSYAKKYLNKPQFLADPVTEMQSRE